jgi:hypothetical protein
MHRNIKSGIYSNNSTRYNIISNKKTKNITYIQDEEYKMKINCNNLYDVSVSQATKKMLNHKSKYYKINNEEDIIDY